MADFSDIHTGKHHVFDTVFHHARPRGFVTKYRHPVFTARQLEPMVQIMPECVRRLRGGIGRVQRPG
jgi:hypothetical protein